MADYGDCLTASVYKLKDQVWYGGMLTRIKSEQMLQENGEFLVRDSISSPGEFVLTAMWNNRALHFQINSDNDNGRREFYLEGESFDSVSTLVDFYRSHRRPLTIASGCVISIPVICGRDSGGDIGSFELEASYMHVLKPYNNQTALRSLSQRVLLNQTALHQNYLTGHQRPKPTVSHRENSAKPEALIVPPVPATLVNRPLPLPLRSPRNDADNEDYSEMDYDAMNDILDASSSSTIDSPSNSSLNFSPNAMSRRYQSCQNLGHRSNSSSLNIAKALPTLSSRPPLPPRPNFRVETSVLADEMLGKGFQSEGTRDGVFFDYDEPRTKFSDDYDKLSSTTTYNLEGVSNRVRGRSSESTDGGTRDSRDSGIYTSPPPPDEHHTLLSQEHLMQLKQFLLTKTPDEIALTLSHEHAKMLRLLEPIYNEEKNGLRLVLLPSGSSLRHELIERCKQLRLTCLLSILCGTREDAHIILKKWILTTISLAYHGDAFACSCLAGTLSENSLKNIKWLWVSLDDEVKNSLEEIKRINESLMKGERLERHNYKTVIPFLQPLLEIMSGTDSCYMNGQSFVTEIESLWLWLDRARHWCLDADELCKTARAKFKHADDSLVDLSFLNRLVSNTLSHDDRQQLLHDMIQKVIDDCS